MREVEGFEILSEETNFAVIRVPSRKFPGILVQGDSLVDLVGTVKDAIELFDTEPNEAKEALNYLFNELDWRLEAYKKVLEAKNVPFIGS